MVFGFNATLADFTAEQLEVLVVINYVVSVLSLAGSLFIVFLYLYFKSQRRFTVRLVFILSLSDIGICVANLMGDPNSNWFCYVQGVLLSFFRLSSVLCTPSDGIRWFGLWVSSGLLVMVVGCEEANVLWRASCVRAARVAQGRCALQCPCT